MKALFLGLPDSDIQDLIDDGMSVEEAKQINMHDGELCECTIACQVSEEFEENFYDIRFADGFEAYTVSGYHLEEVK